MNNQDLTAAFSDLSTPLIADACLRLGVPIRAAPQGIRPIAAGTRLAGRVLPARHYGSVDVFLEAMVAAEPGDILVIDNGGRTDEGCIFPVFSYGTFSSGLQRLDPRDADALVTARFGEVSASREDVVFADDDGVLFAPGREVEALLSAARSIWQTERRQAEAIQAGNTLSKQLNFDEFLSKRSADPAHTFRQHLWQIGGAIEE